MPTNGSGEFTSTATSISYNNSNPFRIGQAAAGGNYGHIGQIDEVGIWNTVLTSTQIQSIYNATSTNLTKDLTTVSGSNLVYWNRMGD